MDDDLHFQIAAANERGQRSLAGEPRALKAEFDVTSGRIIVELTSGCSFAFPAHAVEGLEHATIDQLADVEILGAGYGLHWDVLDVDLSVPGLLAGIFGTRKWLDRQRAANAGATSSLAKAAAARSNGAKGGRPRKVAAR